MHSKRTPILSTDLLLVISVTILTVIFVTVHYLENSSFRVVLGSLFILFTPGYSLIAALFVRKNDLSGIERLALSFGLSIALSPLIGLLLNYTPYGIRLTPILISISFLTLLLCGVAFIRRKRLPAEDRFYVDFTAYFKSFKSFMGASKKERILSLILIISIIIAISSTVYIIVKPKEGERFTEFYILGPDGKASNYPTNLTPGDNGRVIIGIVNHENTPTSYHLVIASNGTVMDELTFNLKNKEKKEINYSFTAGDPGVRKMEFLLFKLPDNNNVYRSLHLWINIQGG